MRSGRDGEGSTRPSSVSSDDVSAALDALHSNPLTGHRIASDLLAAPGLEPSARVALLLGLGRFEQANGAIASALIRYTEALERVADTPDRDTEVEVRISLSSALQTAGRPDEAFHQLRAAEPHARAAGLGRLLTQRGYLLAVSGERQDALAALDQGLPLLVAVEDHRAVMRSLTTRGSLLTQQGSYEEARSDYEQLAQLAQRLGDRVLGAAAAHGFAFANGRIGRMPEALRGFRVARTEFEQLGERRAIGDLDIDECEVLLELGLGADAVPVARRVVDAARAGGNVAQLAEGLLMLARAELIAGDPSAALAAADEAAELFVAGRRAAWAALARYWTVVAADDAANAIRSDDRSAARSRVLRRFVRLRKIADELDRFGWSSEAVDVRVRTGRLALAVGRADVAAGVLRAASTAQRHPLARVRAEAWHAVALLRIAEGDRSGAGRALTTGLKAVEQHRASLGAVELRSAAGRLGAPLAAAGLRLAIQSGRPSAVLEWAEKGRAGALGAPQARGIVAPPGLLSALRTARRALTDATAVDVDDDAEIELADEVARLEGEVTRASRQHTGDGRQQGALRAAGLRRALGEATLVEYVDDAGQLHAVVCSSERVRLVPLGPVAAVSAANDHLAFAVRRLASIAGGPLAERAWAGFSTARHELQQALLGSLAGLIGDGPLVVVPTGALHDVLWGALPVAARRAGLAIAPSAAWWAHPSPPRRRRKVLLVAGPDLGHADDEVQRLRIVYPQAQVLTGMDATVDAVLCAMEAATLVHVAAHGVFRTDNPLFSTIQLHDGPLFVRELEALRRVPDSVVLAACSTGRSGVLPGDELLGTAAVLMDAGVRHVIAPLLQVADKVTADVAVALHTALSARLTPAAAVARVLRRSTNLQRADMTAAAVSFACLSARTS
ncbi:MAG: CHAT domain-containing protein [Ilumatobacteraceae bacterium]